MNDSAGNKLEIGDEVLYLEPRRSTSVLVWGVVEGFTPQMIILKTRSGGRVRRIRKSVVKPFQHVCIYENYVCILKGIHGGR